MKGYTYNTQEEAIEARQKAADFKGYPKPNGKTLYWVNFSYAPDGFYYIRYTEGLEQVLGEPTDITITQEDYEYS